MQQSFDFNYDWQFFKTWNKDMTRSDFAIQGESVTIPHAPRIEELNVTEPFSGLMGYRKLFKIPQSLASKNIFIDFEGVMTRAVVYVNGKKLLTHYGGYLPFSVNITSHVKMNQNNLIVVEVDNRDDSTIPPGKPTDKVDFLYYGGIYRNVTLRATDKIYIDKPTTKKNAGIFVYTEKIENGVAYLSCDVSVVNSYFKKQRVYVKWILFDENEYKVAEVESKEMIIFENKTSKFNSKMIVGDAELWDVDNPYLYNLRCEIYANDELVECQDTSVGIRTVDVCKEGFLLNGKVIRLNGVNRHQQFPYIGIAGSDNMDRRDVVKLKEAGFNIVRLSHYPQSEALMNECDKRGLMVIVATPGWQFSRLGIFRHRVISNIKEMVRRDRNHASAVLWEASLNETGAWWLGATDGFFKKCVNTVRMEFAPYKALVCGDTIGRNNWKKIGYDVPFTLWDNAKKLRIMDSSVRGLTREYGDYEFGGHNSTTRVRIGDGEMAMRVQAFNFQWSHNMNNGSNEELGDLIWEGIDHNRGMGADKPISTSGILNEWRLPKFSYYFFKSQRSDEDMVFIPSFWDRETNGKITVFSNADEVELLVNGKSFARQKPNKGASDYFDSKLFDGKKSVDYWNNGGDYDTENHSFDLAKFVLSKLDNGGNAENLAHAPFTFDDVKFQRGTIEAIAYKNGKKVATHLVRTSSDAKSLALQVDYSGYNLLNDGRDKVFVRAYLLDENGEIARGETGKVKFSAKGGKIVGANSREVENGIASAILVAKKNAKSVKLDAKYKDMTASIDVDIDRVEVEII